MRLIITIANLSAEDVSFNGIVIHAKTIITPDGSVVQPSDEFFINNSYDAAEVRIETSLGNDYVNLSGSQQNILVEWSPGNDTYILDLNEEKHWQSPEFSANWTYKEHVERLNVLNPDGLIFNNNNGPALEVFSDYGKILAFNIQEIETTTYDDIVIGRDNFEENIRLYEGNDTITSGYGGDTIRTKPHDTDSTSNFTITDYSSYDRIQIDEITDLNMNSYWDQFSISYYQGNTLIGINAIGGITNNSLFEIIGEKSLDYIKVEERVYEGQYSPIHLEFYFDDDASGNNLKRYTSDWFGGNTFTIDNDDNSNSDNNLQGLIKRDLTQRPWACAGKGRPAFANKGFPAQSQKLALFLGPSPWKSTGTTSTPNVHLGLPRLFLL